MMREKLEEASKHDAPSEKALNRAAAQETAAQRILEMSPKNAGMFQL